MAGWNGVSFLLPAQQLAAVEMALDASGSWGCGAWNGTQWFQLQWSEASISLPIVVKELLPIVLAAELWGSQWRNCVVHCHCDNQAVIGCLRSRTSKNKHCMHMLRVLVFVEAQHSFHFHPVYINTKANHLADNLSINNTHSFLSKVPEANRDPDQVSVPLLKLLLDMEMDWVSPEWRSQFSATFRQGWRKPHRNPIAQQ